MIPTLGHLAVVIGLLATLYAAGAFIVAGRRGDRAVFASARRAMLAAFGLSALASVAMVISLVTHDFSVSYVARNNATTTPLFYSIISLWAALEGSILFWTLLATGWAALVLHRYRDRLPLLMPWVGATLALGTAFFFAVMTWPGDPFLRVTPLAAEGNGPNALLQNHPFMGLHPPLLYLGYTGLAVPFTFRVAALIARRTDEEWLAVVRRWTLVPWIFLTAGIVAGAWWSYEVLGWGGYWAWDPVENAALLPWLTATAFIHSSMVAERRGTLRTWTHALVIATFVLTLAGALGLLVWRLPELRDTRPPGTVVSRETAFLANNLLFLTITFAVLFGTLYPLIVEATSGARASVGTPWFNRVNAPIFVALLFLTGVGPALPWGGASWATIRERFALPILAGVAASVAALALGLRDAAPIGTLGLAAFVLVVMGEEVVRGAHARGRSRGEAGPVAVWHLATRNRRRYGGYLVHAGICVMAVSIAVSATLGIETTAALVPGGQVSLGGYTLTYQQLVTERLASDARVVETRAELTVAGRQSGQLATALRDYPNSSTAIATPAVLTGVGEDLYVTLLAYDRATGSITLRVFVNPLVVWIWLGGGIVTAGAIFAIWPDRRRQPALAPAEA